MKKFITYSATEEWNTRTKTGEEKGTITACCYLAVDEIVSVKYKTNTNDINDCFPSLVIKLNGDQTHRSYTGKTAVEIYDQLKPHLI